MGIRGGLRGKRGEIKTRPSAGSRFGRISFTNCIAASANRSQVLGFFGISFDLYSQVLDVRANQPGSSCAGRILPDLTQELIGGQDLAGAGHETMEQLKFSWREQDHSAIHQ